MSRFNLKYLEETSQVWFKFSKNINGKKQNFRWEQLPSQRFEDFLDFKMKYYVRREITHTIAGIHKSIQAMKEYRDILKNIYKLPSYYTSICCVDDGTNKIVGFDSLKLYKKGEIYKDFMAANTSEVQRYYNIVQHLDKLCPVPNILSQYGVEQFFDDGGFAVHSDYNGYRFTSEVSLLRYIVCKENNVPLTGAWMTSPAVQQTIKKEGWDTVFEISSKHLETLLGLKLPRTQMFIYKVKNII